MVSDRPVALVSTWVLKAAIIPAAASGIFGMLAPMAFMYSSASVVAYFLLAVSSRITFLVAESPIKRIPPNSLKLLLPLMNKMLWLGIAELSCAVACCMAAGRELLISTV